jgi:hypothetical protein
MEINRIFTEEALKNYIKAYGPLKEGELYKHYFDKKAYILPLVLNYLSVFCVVYFLLLQENNFFIGNPYVIKIINNISVPAVFGFLGAYLWGHFEILNRFSDNDLNSTVFYKIWLGFLLSGIMGYIIGISIVAPLNIFIAFGLGAIPLKNIFDFLSDKTSKQLNITKTEIEYEKSNLHFLQGMNQKIMERIQEEKIYTVQNLSLTNPVKLLLKTNITWAVILDLIDQAILFNYLGEKIITLRDCGIRSALELTNLTNKVFCEPIGGQTVSDELLNTIAQKLNWEKPLLLNVINNLNIDQQLNFIWQLWEEDFNNQEHFETALNRKLF